MGLFKQPLFFAFGDFKDIMNSIMSRKKTSRKKNRRRIFFVIFLLFVCVALPVLHSLKENIMHSYEELASVTILDRNNKMVAVLPNKNGTYATYIDELPDNLKTLLVQKEDRFFYWHVGINPVSTGRAIWRGLFGKKPGGSSTITQQLTKNLLGNLENRTLKNKFIETIYAFSLELYLSKDEILTMYANTAYLGHQAQGFAEASRIYFDVPLEDLNDHQFLSLLATLSSPSVSNPEEPSNIDKTTYLSKRLDISVDDLPLNITDKQPTYISPTYFEVKPFVTDCTATCHTTIDTILTEKLREILNRNILTSWETGARNGAIVVLDVPSNEVLALVGTKDTKSLTNGNQINMTLQPRPIVPQKGVVGEAPTKN